MYYGARVVRARPMDGWVVAVTLRLARDSGASDAALRYSCKWKTVALRDGCIPVRCCKMRAV